MSKSVSYNLSIYNAVDRLLKEMKEGVIATPSNKKLANDLKITWDRFEGDFYLHYDRQKYTLEDIFNRLAKNYKKIFKMEYDKMYGYDSKTSNFNINKVDWNLIYDYSASSSYDAKITYNRLKNYPKW